MRTAEPEILCPTQQEVQCFRGKVASLIVCWKEADTNQTDFHYNYLGDFNIDNSLYFTMLDRWRADHARVVQAYVVEILNQGKNSRKEARMIKAPLIDNYIETPLRAKGLEITEFTQYDGPWTESKSIDIL